MKSQKDDILPFCLFTHNAEDLNPFEFSIDNGSCALFLATNDKEKLRISFKAKDKLLRDRIVCFISLLNIRPIKILLRN